MSAEISVIDDQYVGQRVDNYLATRMKGLPKSRLYRAVRKGEVRVNKKRIKPEYRLQLGDEVRIPPLRLSEPEELEAPSRYLVKQLESRVLYESDNLLMINKISGLSVHGGTGITSGLIEALRYMRPDAKRLELVHRLDRGTSGCLLLAKKRHALLELHEMFLNRSIKKQYLALVQGCWKESVKKVDAPLLKNHLKSGERVVKVDEGGKPSVTRFRVIRRFEGATLLEAIPLTGRTHQIRVHAACSGHPILGDEKYGDDKVNKACQKNGLRRMFLHSSGLSFGLSKASNEEVNLCAPLDADLIAYLNRLVPVD